MKKLTCLFLISVLYLCNFTFGQDNSKQNTNAPTPTPTPPVTPKHKQAPGVHYELRSTTPSATAPKGGSGQNANGVAFSTHIATNINSNENSNTNPNSNRSTHPQKKRRSKRHKTNSSKTHRRTNS